MLKRKQYFFIILLSLLQHFNCQKFEANAVKRLAYLRQRTGFCSQVFQYINVDGFMVGKLTLPDLKLGDTVKLEFFYKNVWINMGLNGSVLPDDTSEEILNRLQTGQPISFRVDFPISVNTPELDVISVNGNEICGALFESTGQKLVLEHTLDITNGALKVFQYDINFNVPYFPEATNCEHNDIANDLAMEMNTDTVVRRGEYPWLAAIYKKEGTSTTFICSGLLLTSELILTAAHCFESLDVSDVSEKLVAHLGRHSLANNQEEDVVVRDIATITLHPDYNRMSSSSDADIALLKMQTAVSFTQFIKPICLWSETPAEPLISGHSGLMVGWTSVENKNSTSSIPKKLKTYIVPQNECLRSSSVYSAITSSRTLCVEKRFGFEPCMKNLGGGLILKRNGRWMLRGIISAGLMPQQSCDSQEYTVFSDIAKYLPWLRYFIGEQLPEITGPLEAVCGVAGGKPRSEHPWLVAIYKKTYTRLHYICTGTLISSRTILAAAHCFNTLNNDKMLAADEFRVYLGRYDLGDIMESGIETREIAILNRHPKYSNTAIGLFFDFDVVLLQMSVPVSFTEYIRPICLWSEPAVQAQIVGESVTLASWDSIGVYTGNLTVAESLEVNVVPMSECNSAGYNGDILSRFLCTPRFSNNAGGILTKKRSDGRYVLRGLSSANLVYLKKYKRQHFRVYSDLAEYTFWIQSNMLL